MPCTRCGTLGQALPAAQYAYASGGGGGFCSKCQGYKGQLLFQAQAAAAAARGDDDTGNLQNIALNAVTYQSIADSGFCVI